MAEDIKVDIYNFSRVTFACKGAKFSLVEYLNRKHKKKTVHSNDQAKSERNVFFSNTNVYHVGWSDRLTCSLSF